MSPRRIAAMIAAPRDRVVISRDRTVADREYGPPMANSTTIIRKVDVQMDAAMDYRTQRSVAAVWTPSAMLERRSRGVRP
eukprot:SAG31_NODE_8092_length_1524_cov_1.894737_2_plen_80_part_00